MKRASWAELFGLDLRSLALFRIALALLVLADLLRRAGDFTAFYTEAGVFPVDLVRALAPGPARFSLHVLASGSPLAEAALFALAGVAALALLLGWRTRIATIVSWFLLASLQARNPWLARMGGDVLLRMLLFWSMFLPLGARFSFDARRDPRLRAAPARYFSAASVALLGQICLLYFSTGILKNGELWVDGTAVRYTLELDPLVTRFGVWLRENGAAVLPLATHGTVWFERLAPLLAFVPFENGPIRTAAIALFLVFHLSLAAALDIGLFPFDAMAAWLAFLPAWFWDEWLGRREPVREAAPAPSLAPSLPVQVGIALLFAWVALHVTLATFGEPMPRPLAAVGSALRLNQNWTMFSPNPQVQDVWLERIGATPGGERFDLGRGERATPEKPVLLSAQESWSWRIWLGYLQGLEADDPLRIPILERVADYSCRDWNAAHPDGERFASIEIVQVLERSLPVGSAPLSRIVQLRRPCPAS